MINNISHRKTLRFLTVSAIASFSTRQRVLSSSSEQDMTPVQPRTATQSPPTAETNSSKLVEGNSQNGNILIAFFSWSGNTRSIAQKIQAMTGADIFEIKPVNPYSTDYNTVLRQAQDEQHAQARPKLAVSMEKSMEHYDTIILGHPNWWASMPMLIASFLESYDFTGKTILPFCSHGGGGFGRSLKAIAKLVPEAALSEGLSVHYSGGPNLPHQIAGWLNQNGIKEQ